MQIKNRRRKSTWCIHFLLFISCIFLLTSCGTKKIEEEQTSLFVFYINKEYTNVVETTYLTNTDIEETDLLVNELLQQLSSPLEDIALIVPLNASFYVENHFLEKKQLTIDFSSGYDELDAMEEILIRAAIVKTLVQLEEVDAVLFTVKGVAIKDSKEQVIGRMDQNTFINSTGSQMSSYEKITIQIYFANEAGDALLPVQRTLVYSSNISMEKLVVDQIIVGPANSDSYPTINEETTVKSVTVKDGICYVKLNKEFLNQTEQVTAEAKIYSIVNSLVEINMINKVQISVEGESEGVLIENIPLSTIFERNLEIIER